jgi:hypothetical protein
MRTQGHVCEFPADKSKITRATAPVSSMDDIERQALYELILLIASS